MKKISKDNLKNKRWEKYYDKYQKKSAVVSFIEIANRNFFTPMFLNEFKRIANIKNNTDKKNNVNKKYSKLKILEPGCGSGLMSSYLAKDNEVTVLDLSKNALVVAKKNFKKINVNGKFVQGNLFKMPFKKNSFDVVWNQGVLEHFKNPVPAMKEMYRVTKNGGYVIIYIPAFLSPLHLVWIFLSAFGLKKLWPFDEQDFYTRKQFKEFMRISGFKDFKIKRLWIKSLGFSQVGYVKKQ